MITGVVKFINRSSVVQTSSVKWCGQDYLSNLNDADDVRDVVWSGLYLESE